MSRYIKIDKCSDCPFRNSYDHYVLLHGTISKFVCTAFNNRQIEYGVDVNIHNPIPIWCPLEKKK